VCRLDWRGVKCRVVGDSRWGSGRSLLEETEGAAAVEVRLERLVMAGQIYLRMRFEGGTGRD